MSRAPLHYAIERAPDGAPVRLVWSPAIQAATEYHLAELRAAQAATAQAARRPAPWIEEWLKTKLR